jgi:ATP-dependent Clp protease protease subunit
MDLMVPYVIEPKGDGERMYDIYSRMLKDRIIFIKGDITQSLADSVVAQMLFLETLDPDADINFYINSHGGSVFAMLSIVDVMTYIKPDVSTFCYGEAYSAASFILAAGTKGKRYALPNSAIMIHELRTGLDGKYKDLDNYHNWTKRLHKKLNDYYVKFTGKTLKKIEEDIKLDHYMWAEEALKYGLIDKVIESRS